MASKTSFFNKAILKKDLTRFAPLWVGFTLLIVLPQLFSGINNPPEGAADEQGALMFIFAYLSVFYAPIAAALLFKDLFNPRLCYTLHSLPVSRGAMFGSHIFSGFLFQLIPTTAMALVSLPFLFSCSQVSGAPYISPAAWAAANLLYLFYFGLATLCMMCVGNLLGFTAMYGLLNIAGHGAYILADNLFRPLLKGVITPYTPFNRMSPFLYLQSQDGPFIIIDWIEPDPTAAAMPGTVRYQVLIGNSWSYAIAIAAIGLIFTAIALFIYRRRNLETAGEFVSYKLLRPLILVSISLAFGTLAMIFEDYHSFALRLTCLLLGMALGYFLGLMLLNRSPKVFQRKNWAGLGLMLAFMILLLGLTKLDPLGIVTRIPAMEKIDSMFLYHKKIFEMESPEEMEEMRRVHALAIDELHSEPTESNKKQYIPFQLTYHLKNGAQVERSYEVHMDSAAGKLLRKRLTTLRYVLEINNYGSKLNIRAEKDLIPYISRPTKIAIVSGYNEEYNGRFRYELPEKYLTEETMDALFKALIADCQEGTMVPDPDYHPPVTAPDGTSKDYISSYISITAPVFENRSLHFDFFPDSRNILAWLDTVGIDSATFWDRYYSG